ncbi:uncharacterized protein N7483_005006 [Penicillium malachiteum]|uniref:uncharacterized protein n=1 Tax=Penicillium malachiteum TaxID=1324776 RepID=UPI002549525A|nr:uncharacterized protein N7483_005006 [Penicillium malachiteum]KAJ5730498.1 hypothetical protein N7483_005006 [Penicillium malachiteum]
MTSEAIKKQNDYIGIHRPIVIGIGLSLGFTATTLIILRLYAYFVIVHKGGRPLIAACISRISHMVFAKDIGKPTFGSSGLDV